MNDIVTVFLSIGILIILFLVRIFPLLKTPRTGCDTYYFLLCAEEFRKNKKIPIILPPYYMLESQEQWYPPGFAIFLGILPESFIRKYYWTISPFIDSLLGVFSVAIAFFITKNTFAAIITGLTYAFSISAVTETRSLNARQLASLLLNISMLSLFWGISGNNVSGYISFIFFGFLVLLTHKMATQNLLISISLLSLLTKDIRYLILLTVLFLFTILITKGFYLKILKAHLDTILFWNRNWKLLGAHQIYHSSIYGDPKKYKSILFYPVKMMKNLGALLLDNILIVPILLIKNMFMPKDVYLEQLFLWLIITFVSSYLITLISPLRLIGEGWKYIKFASPSIAIWAGILFVNFPSIIMVCLFFYFYRYITWIIKLCKENLVGSTAVIDSDFKEIIGYLKNGKEKKIICIPNHLSDGIAYSTKRHVFWGSHNYPFKWVENFMPVWKKRIAEFKNEYKLTHLLVDKNYVDTDVFKEEIKDCVFSRGSYYIFEL